MFLATSFHEGDESINGLGGSGCDDREGPSGFVKVTFREALPLECRDRGNYYLRQSPPQESLPIIGTLKGNATVEVITYCHI